jgi:pyridoxamine 5'-phosphate oxidase
MCMGFMHRVQPPAGHEGASRRILHHVSDDVREEPIERSSYDLGSLAEEAVAGDWLTQFRRWWDDAEGLQNRDAMVLATTDPVTGPSARTVLLRGFDARGLAFYTNRSSRKGRELAAVPRAALCFAWLAQERQVRVTGGVELVADAESDAYFAGRPRGSQVGAWASPQSEVLADRAELERLDAEAEERFAGGPVPRPPHWGGYRVVPDAVEFWQGRPDRLHDRIGYRWDAQTSAWVRERLAP